MSGPIETPAAPGSGEFEVPGSGRRLGVLLVFLCLFFYGLVNPGAVLSPDCEIVLRTAIALEGQGTFALRHGLEGWPGFGVAPGKDSSLYSVFGPLESVILAPLVGVAVVVNHSRWY